MYFNSPIKCHSSLAASIAIFCSVGVIFSCVFVGIMLINELNILYEEIVADLEISSVHKNFWKILEEKNFY